MRTATVLQLTPTWKPSLVLPFESDWSIREKFSFMNAVARSTIKVSQIGDLRASTAEKIPFLNRLTSVKSSQFMVNNQVRVCPECIKYGYHSNLHQYLETISKGPNYYETNHTTTAKNIVDNGQLLKEIIKVSRKFTDHKVIQYINVNYATERKDVIFNSTKAFLLSRVSSQTSYVAGVRRVLSVAKKDLPEVNNSAMKELSDKSPLGYVINWDINKRKLNEQCTSAYMKTIIDDFIRSEFNSENEYYHAVSIMDTWESSGKYRDKEKINRYAKVIMIMHIINSRQPEFYRKLLTEWHYPPFECFHVISVADIMSRLGSVFIKNNAYDGSVHKTSVVTFAHAFLKDIFADTSRRLAMKIRSGEFNLFDDKLISRENFYIPASQYVLMDEIDKVTLYACKPD